MNARRLYVPVMLATLATGGLAFFAASRSWAKADISSSGLPPATVSVTGSDAEPLVSALALVVVTAALAVLAAGPGLRRVVGGLTILVAIAAIVSVPRSGSGALDKALTAAATKSPAFTGADSLGHTTHSLWDLVAIVAFVIAVLLGAATLRWAPQWPTMSSRYDAPTVRSSAGSELSDTDMWKAMDDGHDPTQ